MCSCPSSGLSSCRSFLLPNGTDYWDRVNLLKVPYSDDRELLGDILRFGADVQVLEPLELRAKVQNTLLDAVKRYV